MAAAAGRSTCTKRVGDICSRSKFLQFGGHRHLSQKGFFRSWSLSVALKPLARRTTVSILSPSAFEVRPKLKKSWPLLNFPQWRDTACLGCHIRERETPSFPGASAFNPLCTRPVADVQWSRKVSGSTAAHWSNDERHNDDKPTVTKPQVAIYWDLDNKTPDLDPRLVADRVRAVGEHFGQVVNFRAYANKHTFDHIPAYVREERLMRKQIMWEEQQGLRVPDEPYRCDYCGAKLKTAKKLEQHFKQLHERERQKKVNRARGLQKKKPSKAKRLFATIKEKDERYVPAARDIIKPKSGYRLAADLRSRGVKVREVKDQSQAADAAILSDLEFLLSRQGHIRSIVLVSDDSDYARMLDRLRASERRVVVVGEQGTLNRVADVIYHWHDVQEGLAARDDYVISPERLEQQRQPQITQIQEFGDEDEYEEFEDDFEEYEFDAESAAQQDVDDILFGKSFEENRKGRRR